MRYVMANKQQTFVLRMTLEDGNSRRTITTQHAWDRADLESTMLAKDIIASEAKGMYKTLAAADKVRADHDDEAVVAAIA